MRRQTLLLLAVVLFAIAILATSKEPPKPILKKGDVERFIKTFPLLKNDFEKFGAKYETKSGDVTIPEAMKASSEFLAILKKHGWDEHFFQKAGTIMTGYSLIQYGKHMSKAQAEYEKALKDIESNPDIPEAMKEQLKAQLTAAKGMMQRPGDVLKNIHPEDILLIKPHLEALKKTVEAESEKGQ
jgi:hypothetical protein